MALNTNYMLSAKLNKILQEKRLTLAFAETLTGGYLSTSFTAVSGSSRFLEMSLIAYSDSAKIKHLKVDPKILKMHGPASPECAIAMAQGLQLTHPTDIALSMTGNAGPQDSKLGAPTGKVFIAIADRAQRTTLVETTLNGGRKHVRRLAVQSALELLISHITSHS